MRLRALSAAAAVGFAVIALLLAVGPADAATLPNGFEERTIASGLSLPTAIAWAPDGRMFIAEKKGVVSVMGTDGSLTQLLDISDHVYGIADRGLLGIATDTDFATNHWLYLLYVYEPTPAPSGPERTSRLTRVTVGDDGSVSDETVILGAAGTTSCPAPSNTLDCIPADSDSHSIGTVRSAPDGTLWLGSGDGSDWSRVDPRALRVYDEQSFAGKIIHVDRNGMGLPGHAFCPGDNDLTHVCTKLYAKGLRNPFRFTLRSGSGPVVGDVGWEQREEIDLMTAPGRNYGWPCYEGNSHTPGYQELAGCADEYAKEGSPEADTPPDHDYPHDESTGWQGAVVPGPVYPGCPYPDDFDGDVIFGDYTGAYIMRLKLDPQGKVAGVADFATGAVTVDIELGPKNELYYADIGDGSPGTGSIKRVVYTPANRTPVAQAAATPSFGARPLTVSFSGEGSSDPDEDPIEFDWDFGDGTAHSHARDPVHVYQQAGEFEVRVTVTDDHGASATAIVAVSVDNSPPAVTIDSPVDGSQFLVGSTIPLRASANDPEDGELSGRSVQWQVSLVHKAHTHDLTGLEGAETSFTAASDHDADAHYRITVIATDSAGRSESKQVEIYPRAVSLTLASSPPGAPLTYVGTTDAAPVVRTSAIDFVSSISAASSFTANGTTYEFVGWSDGGARAHDFAIPSVDTTLTATYEPVPAFTEPPAPPPVAGIRVPGAAPSAGAGEARQKACSHARARRKRLRRLRRRYRLSVRRLRRIDARLARAVRDVHRFCARPRTA